MEYYPTRERCLAVVKQLIFARLPMAPSVGLSLFSMGYEQAGRLLAAPPWPGYMSKPERTDWKRKVLEFRVRVYYFLHYLQIIITT